MRGGLNLYSQWFPGTKNDFADSLSRDFHIDPKKLATLLKTIVPSQVPPTFKIKPLLHEISSWLEALLLQLPEKTQGNERHQKSKLLQGQSESDSLQ